MVLKSNGLESAQGFRITQGFGLAKRGLGSQNGVWGHGKFMPGKR